MSSINQHYTFNYSQPEDYRFSHDSVFMARRVFEMTADQEMTSANVLDLCAGSGIIGLDFLFHRRVAGLSLPVTFDFLEIQEVYRSHFLENVTRLGKVSTLCHFLNRNYDDLQGPEYSEKYNLIMCNPPYFLQGQGKLSPSDFKNRCRFFLDSDLKNLIFAIRNCLKSDGAAYVLLRDLPEHGWDIIAEVQNICSGILKMEILGDIRGTHLSKFSRI